MDEFNGFTDILNNVRIYAKIAFLMIFGKPSHGLKKRTEKYRLGGKKQRANRGVLPTFTD